MEVQLVMLILAIINSLKIERNTVKVYINSIKLQKKTPQNNNNPLKTLRSHKLNVKGKNKSFEGSLLCSGKISESVTCVTQLNMGRGTWTAIKANYRKRKYSMKEREVSGIWGDLRMNHKRHEKRVQSELL